MTITEIMQQAQALSMQERRELVRLLVDTLELEVVLDENADEPAGITGAELLAAEFIGAWKDRDDIGDTAEFADELRRKSQKRG
jgi:glycerol kinase